jgi:hypothetical protein
LTIVPIPCPSMMSALNELLRDNTKVSLVSNTVSFPVPTVTVRTVAPGEKLSVPVTLPKSLPGVAVAASVE